MCGKRPPIVELVEFNGASKKCATGRHTLYLWKERGIKGWNVLVRCGNIFGDTESRSYNKANGEKWPRLVNWVQIIHQKKHTNG